VTTNQQLVQVRKLSPSPVSLIEAVLKNYSVSVPNRGMQIPTGEDIRAARKDKGLTQSELAERAGVSQPLIARIESDDVDPTIDTLYSIVSALNDSTSDVRQEEVKISMPSVLEDARKRTGYTQGELADVAGVSQPLISRIEREDVNPRSSTLRSLFDQLESATDSPDTEPSASPTSASSLREKIEWEFENVQSSSESSAVNEDDRSDVQRCPECGSDLASSPHPNYCPDCGAEL
jgi:predicted transcriptional regulator